MKIMKMIKANEDQYESVRSFYHSLIDAMKDSQYDIGWEMDIYPSPEFLKESIAGGDLYICTEDNHIVGAMVLNHRCNEAYRKFQWRTEASEDEIMIIHALGVHPAYSGKGYARAMVRKALEASGSLQSSSSGWRSGYARSETCVSDWCLVLRLQISG